ncbi:MAG: prepilin peptidase [Alphaproteobacteria bacterium]|nr:prepilin peptidase [Alphaproteobacteria bacterium]
MQIFSYLTAEMQIFLVAVIALIFGSFGTLVSYRLARKQPIIFARSQCPNCGYKLKAVNLIPLFSWIFQRGKCSNCHTRISLRYPLIELSFLAAFLTVYFALNRNLNAQTFTLFAIATTLICMVIIDLEEYFIPDSLQYFLAILVTILVILKGGTPAVLANIPAAFLYLGFGVALWLFFHFAAHIDALGIDDLKFFFISGFALGTKNFLTFMLLSGVLGTLFGVLWQKLKKDETFPFAPAICVALFLCLLFQKQINPVDLLGSILFLQNSEF